MKNWAIHILMAVLLSVTFTLVVSFICYLVLIRDSSSGTSFKGYGAWLLVSLMFGGAPGVPAWGYFLCMKPNDTAELWINGLFTGAASVSIACLLLCIVGMIGFGIAILVTGALVGVGIAAANNIIFKSRCSIVE